MLNTLNENKEAETITKHIVRRVEDTPENMERLIIDSNSEYDVKGIFLFLHCLCESSRRTCRCCEDKYVW